MPAGLCEEASNQLQVLLFQQHNVSKVQTPNQANMRMPRPFACLLVYLSSTSNPNITRKHKLLFKSQQHH
jgi:hypothetical protein